jgi:hypothetical protein
VSASTTALAQTDDPNSAGAAKARDIAPPLMLPDGWAVCGLADALAGSGQRPPWIIENLLLAQSATQVSAHPHSMKSLAWLAACIESVAKHTVWNHFDASAVRRSLFIESEDSKWLVEQRIREIAKGMELTGAEDAPGFNYLRTGPFDLVQFEATLSQMLRHYRPDFVVLSTLQSLLNGRDWNEQADMQQVNAAIVRLASLCPLVVITHSPWDRRARRAAGSITQAANFATTIHFEKVVTRRSSNTFVHVSVDSKAGAEQADFSLKLQTDGVEEIRGIVYEGEGWPKGVGKAAVLAALEEDPDASPKEIAERVGVTARYVQKLNLERQEKPRKSKK